MILGQALEPPVAKAVDAAVSGVRHAEAGAPRMHGGDRRAHSALLGLARGSLTNARIGELRRGDKKRLRIAGLSPRIHGPDGSTIFVETLHGLSGDGSGELACRVAAHAVEDEVKSQIGSEGEDVLVDGATTADFGAASGFNMQNSRQESSQSARSASKLLR